MRDEKRTNPLNGHESPRCTWVLYSSLWEVGLWREQRELVTNLVGTLVRALGAMGAVARAAVRVSMYGRCDEK